MEATSNNTNHLNILIAEDDEMSFLYLSIILKSISGNIVHAKNGKEAIDKISSLKFDLALLDINLPGLSGIEVAKSFRKEFPQLGIIINSSEYPDEARLKQLKKMDIEYFIKPISHDNIHAAIKKVMKRSKEN